MPTRTPSPRQAMLSDVFYLVLRRMRFPLLLVIGVYAFCTAGLSLIPGTDANGDPTRPLTVFEAFYVVSYTSTTIGFGEVPWPYNAAQRMWMTMTIYVSVAAWTYSLFNVIALLQDAGFQNAVRSSRFARKVGQLREPFYIVCGIGETGRTVCHGLDHLGLRFVAIEQDPERLQQLRLDEFSVDPPTVEGDAGEPVMLERAGVLNPFCKGVVALTDDDATNQAIAVSVRLMAPRVPVLARIRNAETETHIGVFGGDVVVNPFERFAEYLAAAITAPERYRLREMITGLPGDPILPISQPPRGHWIVCGFGRFGRSVSAALRAAGMQVTVIDTLYYDQGGVDVKGTGTNSEDLKAAGIETAVGLVTANSSDTKNLSIAVTARALNHDLYIVNRQNVLSNSPLFASFGSNLTMVPSRIVAQEFLARITTPLMNRFLRLIPQHNEAECAQIYQQLATLDPGLHPEIWDLPLIPARAPALIDHLNAGGRFTVGHLRADPFDRGRRLALMVMLIRRDNKNIQLPPDDFVLHAEDRLLLAGSPRGKRHVELPLHNANTLHYVLTGQESNGGHVWRWLTRKHPLPIVPLPAPEHIRPPLELEEPEIIGLDAEAAIATSVEVPVAEIEAAPPAPSADIVVTEPVIEAVVAPAKPAGGKSKAKAPKQAPAPKAPPTEPTES